MNLKLAVDERSIIETILSNKHSHSVMTVNACVSRALGLSEAVVEFIMDPPMQNREYSSEDATHSRADRVCEDGVSVDLVWVARPAFFENHESDCDRRIETGSSLHANLDHSI